MDNVFFKYLFTFLFLFSFSAKPMEIGHIPWEITKQIYAKKNQMHESGNILATDLHAAAELGHLEWIKAWVKQNCNKNNFKELILKRDCFMLTSKQRAIYASRQDVVEYLQQLEDEN